MSDANEQKLTHLDESGAAHMVDVSAKPITQRAAKAEAVVRMQSATLSAITTGDLPKGDVFAVARIAGIQAAKRTDELIPLCHGLPLDAVEIDIAPASADAVRITATCRVAARTGVEMEALTAASVAALTIYDMCKAIDRGIEIASVRLLTKSGGRSGDWSAESARP